MKWNDLLPAPLPRTTTEEKIVRDTAWDCVLLALFIAAVVAAFWLANS